MLISSSNIRLLILQLSFNLRYNGSDNENEKNDTKEASGNAASYLLITGHKNGNIRFWDTETGRLVTTLTSHKSQVNALVFSPQLCGQIGSGNCVSLRLISVASDLSLKVTFPIKSLYIEP